MMYMHNQEQYNHDEVRHDEVMRRVQLAMSKISGDDVAAVLRDLSAYQGEEIAALHAGFSGLDVRLLDLDEITSLPVMEKKYLVEVGPAPRQE